MHPQDSRHTWCESVIGPFSKNGLTRAHVREFGNGEIDAGYHETKVDGRNLASGVYFNRIQAGGFVETERFLLVR